MHDVDLRPGATAPLNIIIPMAGNDFEKLDGSVKAEMPVGKTTLLGATLEARPWWGAATVPVFVLRDKPVSRRYAQETLLTRYPTARLVWLSEMSGGAAWSAAAGAALVAFPDSPVVIDLCDIIFDSDADIAASFAADSNLGGLALTFGSRNPQYSYIRLGDDGRMLEAREKIVISDNASAGVYAFRNVAIFHLALTHSLQNRASLAHNGLLFVCPMLNGVVAHGFDVRTLPARDVFDVKIADAALAG
ncbi:hypothetical protein FHX08_006098 [Rhizobium sp. BK529]|uniref:hypothetical protein n=1 Tax=unclassified Rhizobium TaxID=2613769 RepID=UPI0010DBD79C|nr:MULTISPECIES: hypothetical protein [unclassified Rhizobium]MBB3595681.1 hypothetical protein [Rhizobium sp. BK529]TCR98234.1 hypothetical protein EV281_10941 [Rhizobium sp. BK418]